MRKKKRITPLVAILVLLLTILSCSSPINSLFATSTPTASRTPTSTRTPTITPLPPIDLYGCAYYEDCPDVPGLGEFIGGEIETGISYQVDVPYDTPARISTSWCSIDDATLDENLRSMEFIFTVDGISYINDIQIENRYNSQGYSCVSAGVIMSGWEIGELREIVIGMTFIDEIFDGWDTYPPGTQIYTFIVDPVELPTETPTHTATATKPNVPSNTLPPPCEISSSINIQNNTGGVVAITLNGPGYFTFNLAVGDNTLAVCPGIYTFYAWGCGDYLSGTINGGESTQFYCQ